MTGDRSDAEEERIIMAEGIVEVRQSLFLDQIGAVFAHVDLGRTVVAREGRAPVVVRVGVDENVGRVEAADGEGLAIVDGVVILVFAGVVRVVALLLEEVGERAVDVLR